MKTKSFTSVILAFLFVFSMAFCACSESEPGDPGTDSTYPVINKADTILRSSRINVVFSDPVPFKSGGYDSIKWDDLLPGSAEVPAGAGLTPPSGYSGNVTYQYKVVSSHDYEDYKMQNGGSLYRVNKADWADRPAGAVNQDDYLFIKAERKNNGPGNIYCLKVGIIPVEIDPALSLPRNPNPVFDIDNLPSTAWWNENYPHNPPDHTVPDIFQFADGRRVQTPDEWEARRAEIKKIVEYYEYGKMPPVIPENISWVDGGDGAGSVSCTITVVNGAASQTWTLTAALPSTPLCEPMPVLFNFNMSSWNYSNATYTDGGIATTGINYSAVCQEQGSNDKAGIVKNLFPEYFTGENEISNMAGQAWAVTVIAYVIQEGGFMGKFDPAKIITNGMSRLGKASVISGAYMQTPPSDKYPNGNRIGIAVSGSSGGGGAGFDRFLSPLGYIDPDTGLANGRWELNGINRSGSGPKNYYLIDDPDLSNSSGANAKLAVRGWPASPGKNPGDPGYYPAGADYGGTFTVRNTTQEDSRIETLIQARGERTWFAGRFYTFANTHTDLDVDRDLGQPNRGKNGIACSTPFEQHYLHSLIAPNGFIIHEGYQTYRGGPEPQFMSYLCAREVWEFLGAGEMLGMRMYDIPHLQPDYEHEDVVNFAKAIWGPNPTAPDERFRKESYPVDDPRSKYDYYRLDWARPGALPLAKRVQEMLEEAGADASGYEY